MRVVFKRLDKILWGTVCPKALQRKDEHSKFFLAFAAAEPDADADVGPRLMSMLRRIPSTDMVTLV